MQQYLAQGRREAALRHYQVCVEVLQRELGVEPEAETKALYRESLRANTRLAARPAWREEIAPEGPPLVGRRAELAELRRALAAAAGGRGGVVLVVGETGIGKSRLVAEIGVLAASEGRRVLVGRASPGQQTIPFTPWLHALRTGGVLDDTSLGHGLDRRRRSELARLFPELGEPPRAAAGPEAQVRLFEAVAHLLEHVTRTGPLVVLLEDLHWADEASARLLCFVARRLRGWPLLLVATAREEDLSEQPALSDALREPGTTRLALGPLTRPESDQLVLALSRARQETDSVARLAAQLWSASLGSPLMVVETMRTLGERVPTGGTLPADRTPLPERVREVIALRLDRLGERGKRLAALAAVVEFEIGVVLLERASGLGERAVVEGIEELVRRRVLRVAGEHFEFVHPRIREVAYEGLLAPRRRLLHREVAEALETLHPEAPPAAVLAQHYRKAEAWAKAVEYLRRAGTRAIEQTSFREAATCLQQALDALDRLPSTPERVALGIDLRVELRASLSLLGEHPHALERLREARVAAEALGDRVRLARVLAQTIGPLRLTSRPDEALAVGERALELARALGDPDLVLLVGSELGALHYVQWNVDRAAALLEETARELEGRPPELVSRHGPRIHGLLATVCGGRSRFDEAIAHGERALAMAEAAGRPEWVAFALYCLAFACQRRGEQARAISLSERCLALAREHEIASAVQWAAATLGDAKAALGRGAEAVAVVEEAVSVAAATQSAEPSTRVALARVYLSCGRLDDSARELERSLAESRRLGKRGVEATAIHLGADLAAVRGRSALAQANAGYERAMALADRLEIRHLVAHCHRGLAEVAARQGERNRAAQHRTMAEALYRELGMTFWVEHMEAARSRSPS
jgi:tetratricopeptide (TPR) repeat protein